MKRRSFLRQTASWATVTSLSQWPVHVLARPDITQLTILHTNDLHSRVDPFPMDGGRNQGLGGAARRASLIQQIRQENDHVLLLDSGDFFQGTPYFNFFEGELDIKLMSLMEYDASTIGNHDFDAGVDTLSKQLNFATFPLLNCNYNLSNSVLGRTVQPYKVFSFGKLKVGVMGVGIALKGLVPEKLFGDIEYQDPIQRCNATANILRNREKCDYVICLSHLGYKYRDEQIDDVKLARSSSGIDLILGGHTHTFMSSPELISNRDDKPVTINQVGWAGIYLGRLDIYFERNKKDRCLTCKNLPVQ